MNSCRTRSLFLRSFCPNTSTLTTLISVTMYGTLSVLWSSFMITLKRYCCFFTIWTNTQTTTTQPGTTSVFTSESQAEIIAHFKYLHMYKASSHRFIQSLNVYKQPLTSSAEEEHVLFLFCIFGKILIGRVGSCPHDEGEGQFPIMPQFWVQSRINKPGRSWEQLCEVFVLSVIYSHTLLVDSLWFLITSIFLSLVSVGFTRAAVTCDLTEHVWFTSVYICFQLLRRTKCAK